MPRWAGRQVSAINGCAGGPFSTHAEAQQETERRQLRDGVREAASGAGNRVHDDGSHQRAGAADAVGNPAECEAADGGGEKGEGVEEAGGARVHRELADQEGEDQRVQHHVHGVEHPAEAAGDKGLALGGVVSRGQPKMRGLGDRRWSGMGFEALQMAIERESSGAAQKWFKEI